MYFYIYDGELYWGRHQKQRPHRSLTTWIFRNKPMKEDHWYISGPYVFRYRKTYGKIAVNVIMNNIEKILSFSVPNLTVCYVTSQGSVMEIENKHDIQSRQFASMFRNRLNEYKGRYFLPIDKFLRYV